MVIREFRCTGHDHEFESTEEHPACPYGCNPKFVVREFRTPFSIGTETGSTIDRLQRTIAADYGMTDMHNDRDSSVMERTRKESGGMRRIGSGQNVREYRPEQTPMWAPSIFNPAPGWSKTGEVPKFDWQHSGFRGPGGSPTQPQLNVAKNILKSNTVIEKSWKQ